MRLWLRIRSTRAMVAMRAAVAFCLICVALALPMEASTEEVSTSRSGGFSWGGLSEWLMEKGGAVQKKKTICEALDWRQASMKVLKDMPAAGLFEDLKGTSKWEISGMSIVDGEIYMIYDNLHQIGKVDQHFEYLAKENVLIDTDSPDTKDDSSFESIEYAPDTGTFLVTREAIAHPEDKGVWHASVVEAKVSGTGPYKTIRECYLDYDFTSENKGVEGGAYLSKDGKRYFLGLCEGNYCKGGAEGRDPGNGRLIVSSFVDATATDKCMWKTEKVISLPKDMKFQDYADVSILGSKIAIVSQEEAALWIGDFDAEKIDVTGPGVIYHFPRDPECDPIYCNVEGIAFIDEYRIAAATDRAKADQKYNCVPHDQSVMVFQLPSPVKQPQPKPPSPQEM